MDKDEYRIGQNQGRRRPGHPSGGMGRMEKSKDFKGTWAKLLKYCRSYWIPVIIAIVFAVAGTVLTIIGPDKLSELTDIITDGIMTGIDMDAAAEIVVTLIAFYAMSSVFSASQSIITATVTQRISKKLRTDISEKSTVCRCGITTEPQRAIFSPVSQTM